MNKLSLSLVLILSLLSSCANTEKSSSQETRGKTGEKKDFNYYHESAESLIEELNFDGELGRIELADYQKRGINTIIDLRGKDEISRSTSRIYNEYGFTHNNIPFLDEEENIRIESIEAVSSILKNSAPPYLIHCSTGNRATGWVTLYLIQEYDLDFDTAYQYATSQVEMQPELKQKVRAMANELKEKKLQEIID